MEKTIVIVAGGQGRRMGSEQPKQFLDLSGKAVLLHTLENLHHASPAAGLIVVLPEDQISTWQQLCRDAGCAIPHLVVKGGAERSVSVQNGLEAAGASGFVAIHDGVRPFVTPALLQSLFNVAAEKGSAIPVLPLRESLRKKMDDSRSRAVDRSRFMSVQTPQCFLLSDIREAYGRFSGSALTDDAAVW